MKKNKTRCAVSWFLPNKKKKFCESTFAESAFIEALGSENLTFNQAFQKLCYASSNEKFIIKTFIENGFGNEKISRYIQ